LNTKKTSAPTIQSLCEEIYNVIQKKSIAEEVTPAEIISSLAGVMGLVLKDIADPLVQLKARSMFLEQLEIAENIFREESDALPR